jgi:sucrose-6-phosphate hydrolase SacC (GH32 family)
VFPRYDDETGLYHLMYQYLTPRVFGHAVSSNMVDWRILDTALNYTGVWYTQVPGETPGVYSGSATQMQGNIEGGKKQIWISASTPTNDMMILAYPSNLSDPNLENWTWDTSNPVIFADSSPENAAVPPGRDPTEFWPCGVEGADQWCMGYATQLSEGCPCSNVSGIAIFSATFDKTVSMSPSSWSEWEFEGYMLNDTAGAVMWECVDFFPLHNDTDPFTPTLWVLKYSIGPGPS